MIKKDIFPLVIVLSENDYITFETIQNQDNNINNLLGIISKNYYYTCLINDDTSNVYLLLDISKLENDFYNDKIYLDGFTDLNGNKKYIYCVFHSTLTEFPTRLGLIKNRDIHIEKKDIEVVDVCELVIKVGIDYINNKKDKSIIHEQKKSNLMKKLK